jgi:hypothetical protein
MNLEKALATENTELTGGKQSVAVNVDFNHPVSRKICGPSINSVSSVIAVV